MRNSILISLSVLLVSVATAAHADTISMTVKSKSGDIKGSGKEKGREGAMTCTEFGFEVSSPREVASGRATGKRQYKPVRCVKRVDKASPLLFKALTANEVLAEVNFQVLAPNPGTGMQSKVYSVVLKSAYLTGLRQFVDANGVLMEELTLSFALITLTWADGDITAVDDLYPAN